MTSHKTKANAIRALAMDAVEHAKSGHPGAPMGMADIAEVLWCDYMKHNPANPAWVDRDRFVLSNGHASMLIYALLHLTGYPLSMAEIKNFRQLNSKTPGHPEWDHTPGVETTTGPLGQGLANAVGMALAEKILAAQFNRPKYEIVNHYTYVFLGDGCLMEGISHEACSLAGTLGLSKLIAFYDDNGVSIDGAVKGWFTDDTVGRFHAYGWHVIAPVDGHDRAAIVAAIEHARSTSDQPVLICCQTNIGHGAPNKAGQASCHGAPLGADEVAAARAELDWAAAPFEIPADIAAAWDAREQGEVAERQWQETFTAYEKSYPELAGEFTRRMQGQLPSQWQASVNSYIKQVCEQGKDIATRQASGQALEAYTALLPELIGGSADLASSNITLTAASQTIGKNSDGNYIYFGVREFAMTAVASGLALHGGFIPYVATFLTFSDYARNAVRMAALMQQRVILVYTHDSIGLGEDGPTHQSIEHLASLRLIPNLDVWRPCDAVEATLAWKSAIESHTTPCVLAFSRQTLPTMSRSTEQLAHISHGAYVLVDCKDMPELIIIATGSEVGLAVRAQQSLTQEGHQVRVVAMPCVEMFERQDKMYQVSVLPPTIRQRLVIEAGVTGGWYKYAGPEGQIIGIDVFGKSAPGADLFEYFGFTDANVLRVAKKILN